MDSHSTFRVILLMQTTRQIDADKLSVVMQTNRPIFYVISLYYLPVCLDHRCVTIFDLVDYADKSADYIGQKFLRGMRHYPSTHDKPC